jgi:Zn-dependent protease
MDDLMMRNFAAYALPVLLAITLHEAAHAYVAKFFGDETAYQQGRMSLNPAKHIDPIGTLLIPVVLYFLKAPFMFGYAKPVPVEVSRLRNPRRDMALVALAGPAANLLMAVLWVNLGALLPVLGVMETFFYEMAKAGVYVNLVFFALNLLPLPPLDGGRVLTSLLPPRLGHKFARIEPYGFFVVLALLVTGLIMHWMVPVATFGASVVQALSFV